MDDSGTSAGDQMLAACDPAAATDVDPARVVAVVPAVVAEREVGVVVYDADDGRRVAVVDVASCDLEADRAL